MSSSSSYRRPTTVRHSVATHHALTVNLSQTQSASFIYLSWQEQQRRRAAQQGGGGSSSWTGNGNSNSNHGGNDGHPDDEDKLTQERMPFCVGICVLLAIVYVLSRTGDAAAVRTQEQLQHANMRASGSSSSSSVVPTSMTTPTSGSTIQMVPSNNNNINAATIPPNTIQMVPSETTPAVAAMVTAANPQEGCDCADANTNNLPSDPSQLMGQLRQQALANTPPHIIECAAAEDGADQSACHLPRSTRQVALQQKGATLWMTGCSGAGKTTIATALEDILVKNYGKHVYRLDGDNLRTGINRDLGFSEWDRAESVRRTGELATLFSDAGVITLVGLISPYRKDRDEVRKRHEEQGIPFYEVYLDVPIQELFERDPKGQYARVKSGELKHFTCIDDPYEEPLQPEIVLRTHELKIEESANILFRRLERDGILQGAPKVTPPGLPNPDGDKMIDLHVSETERASKKSYAASLPKVLITDIDLNWLQTVGEGWAAPLTGFMREGMLLETLHFNSILVDPFNVTGNELRLQTQTDFNHFPKVQPLQRVSMPIPITLSCTSYTKGQIETSGKTDVALTTRMGHTVAILKGKPQNRMCSRK